MKTKSGTSVALALLFAMGVFATMLALGLSTSSKVDAGTVVSAMEELDHPGTSDLHAGGSQGSGHGQFGRA